MASGINGTSLAHLKEIPIYVINLRIRTDRKDHATLEASRHGLSVQFVEAVEGEKVDSADLGLLSAPALACWESHLSVFQLISNSSFQKAVVLEDDFEFTNFGHLLKKLKKIDLDNWDIVQVGFLTHDIKEWISIKLQNVESFFFIGISRLFSTTPLNGMDLKNRLRVKRAKDVPFGFIPDDLRAGAHAYIISRNCAQRLLNSHSSQRVLTTDGLFIALNWTKQFRTLRLQKSLVRQISSPSSIKES
jgi:GR25 family glycosyltransferase involved in LPS biosynthesis